MTDSERSLSRRNFLKIVVPASGIVATGLVAYYTPRETARTLYEAVDPELSPSPTGALSATAARSMVAFAEALCRVPIDASRYSDFYRWRSANVPGHHALYERFANELDEVAERHGVATFSALSPDQRIAFSDELRDVELTEREKLWATVGNRDWIRFNQIIVEDTLRLFANTDLWLHVGYDDHIGMPRGLMSYTKPPPGDSAPDSNSPS